MRLFHFGAERRLSLLAAGVLEGTERERALEHIEACTRCRRDWASLKGLMELLSTDSRLSQDLPISLSALVGRVRSQIDALPATFPGQSVNGALRRFVLPLTAAAAVGALAVFVIRLQAPSTQTPARISEETLERLEGSLARERAARYLIEAQDVLVTVASAQQHCDRRTHRLDVAEEARRSRALLAKRAILVEMDDARVASVEPVLQDVENVLRDVAALESCARASDLEMIHKEISERRLLMRINLMSRELRG